MPGNPHPIDAAIVDAAQVAKADVRAHAKQYVRHRVGNAQEIRDTDFSGQFGGLYVRALQADFDIDTADLITADDGTNCIIDAAGNRFKKRPVDLLGQSAYTITTNGNFTLPADKSNIVLKPGTPSIRTINLPTGATRRFSVADGLGNWATYNHTFAVAGGTINGAATWVGTMDWGRFEFNPLGDGNYLASGIG